ncbi:MAG: DUF4097 family beta strand repeat-containing protein [Rudaea sp.]
MSEFKQTWPQDAFDAVRVMSTGGQLSIEGYEGNEVVLEGNHRSRWEDKREPQGRWLPVRLFGHHGEGDMTLRLPRGKSWVVEAHIAKGRVQARNLRARLRVMIGKGDIEVENCQGVLALAVGKGSIKADGCTQQEMPARPPLAQEDLEFSLPPMPEGGIPAGFGFRGGPWMGKGKFRHMWGISEEDADAWAEWGEHVGQQASAWTGGFLTRMLHGTEWPADHEGIGAAIGKGDIELAGVQAANCAVRVASGDIKIERGQVENLNVSGSRGDVDCRDVMPLGEWSMDVTRGDIHLSLPADTNARIDAATRHGDIDSEVPLVRVGRPGPEARRGGRMVGTVGATEGRVAAISLTTMAGDIEIEYRRGEMRHEPQPAAAAAAAAPAAAARPQESDRPAPGGAGLDSQFAVLQALSKGEISVDEAEQLLKSLR